MSKKRSFAATEIDVVYPEDKKRKLNDEIEQKYKPNIPLEIIAAVQSSTVMPTPLSELIAQYSFGYDDAIHIEFGGAVSKYNELIGLEPDDDEGCYQFLKKHAHVFKAMYPPLEYRENGLLKDIWNDLPHILRREGFKLNIVKRGRFHEYCDDLKHGFMSIVKRGSQEWDSKRQKEAAAVWESVRRYYERCNDTDLALLSVWLPVGGVLWQEAEQEAREKGKTTDWNTLWNFMKERTKKTCVAECGFYGLASRQTFADCFEDDLFV